MIGVFKFLACFFAFLALASLGHDVWRAVEIDNKFTLSQFGWLFQNYAPAAHDAFRSFVIEKAGSGFFNSVFGFILSIYTLVLMGGLAAVFSLLMLWLMRKHNPHRTTRTFRHRPNR